MYAVCRPEQVVDLPGAEFQTGAQLLTDESITRIIRQAVETTETIQISRSIDDKLSGLFTTANAILATMRDDMAATRGFTRQVV